MIPLQRIAVIAGNYREYSIWCAENGHPLRGGPAFYATVESLGHNQVKVEVVRTGSWSYRTDLPEIEAILAARNREPQPGEHCTSIGYEHADFLYFARCSCGVARYWTTWDLTLK